MKTPKRLGFLIATLLMTFYFVMKYYIIRTQLVQEDSYQSMYTFEPELNKSLRHPKGQPLQSTTEDTCPHKLMDIPLFDTASQKNCDNCEKVTCRHLIYGDRSLKKDEEIYDRTMKYMKAHPKISLDDGKITEMTKNCYKFTHNNDYILQPLSQEEEEFPIAFNLLVHKDAEQVEKLLRAIYQPQNSYCIHVDRSSSETFHKAINSIAACFPNVFLASKLEDVVYGGFSRLQADINCMEDHLKSNIPWKYLLNVAGQAFPLKTNIELVKILKVFHGVNDIEGITGFLSHIHSYRYQLQYSETRNRSVSINRVYPKPPRGLSIVKGSAYGSFSRAFVEYIFNDTIAQEFLKWSRKTYSPDEHYWATLHHTYINPHLKTPGAFSGNPNGKPMVAVYAKWEGATKCYGKWVRDVCVYGIQDLPDLRDRREMFANKFYHDYEPLALQCLESWIKQRTLCPEPFDTSGYKQLSFVWKAKESPGWIKRLWAQFGGYLLTARMERDFLLRVY